MGLNAYFVATEFRTPYIIELRPSVEFNYEAGKSKLASIRLPSDVELQSTMITPDNNSYHHDEYEDQPEPGRTGRFGKLLRLSGRVDLESRLTIGSCGAVLTYLSRRKAVQFLPGDLAADLAFRVSTIEMFNLDNTM